jgi:hypothetical protein
MMSVYIMFPRSFQMFTSDSNYKTVVSHPRLADYTFTQPYSAASNMKLQSFSLINLHELTAAALAAVVVTV